MGDFNGGVMKVAKSKIFSPVSARFLLSGFSYKFLQQVRKNKADFLLKWIFQTLLHICEKPGRFQARNIGFTNFPGNSRESLNSRENSRFPGNQISGKIDTTNYKVIFIQFIQMPNCTADNDEFIIFLTE